MTDKEKIAKLEEALKWIYSVAVSQYEKDRKLRADAARTLKRIADRCDAALGINE